MKKIIYAGATDQTIDIFVQSSAVTTGAGLTGLAYNTASLVCYYRKGATGSATALTLATQTVGGAHSDGGFVEIDATNMPGMYRLDLSDTIVATAGTATLMLKGATNMAPVTIELQLVAYNPEDGVRLGLTALPNAAADAAGGLPISDAGGLDLDAQIGTDIDAILVDTGTTLDGRIPAALVGGRMDANVGAISTDATAADNLEAALDGTGSVTITAAITGDITGNLSGSVGSVTGAVGSVTGNVGGNVVGSVASVAGNVGGNLLGNVSGGVGGNVSGSVASVVGAVGSVTGAVGSVTGAVGSVTGNVGGNVTGSVGSLATQAKADVNAEVLDVLNVDTFAEPGQEAPAATNTLVKKIGYLFKFLRNKVTQTSTTLSVYDDAGTTVDQKATVSDDATTYTRGEIGTGP